jgi:hypothetical protein
MVTTSSTLCHPLLMSLICLQQFRPPRRVSHQCQARESLGKCTMYQPQSLVRFIHPPFAAFCSQVSSFLTFVAEVAPESIKKLPNLTETPRGEASGKSKARHGHPPTSVQPPDEQKAMVSPNEQGRMDVPRSNFQQGSASNDSNLSLKTTDALLRHPRNPTEIPKKTPTTQSPLSTTEHDLLDKLPKQHAGTSAQASLLGRDGRPPTIGQLGQSQADVYPESRRTAQHHQLPPSIQCPRSKQPSGQQLMSIPDIQQLASSRRSGHSDRLPANSPVQQGGFFSIFKNCYGGSRQ